MHNTIDCYPSNSFVRLKKNKQNGLIFSLLRRFIIEFANVHQSIILFTNIVHFTTRSRDSSRVFAREEIFLAKFSFQIEIGWSSNEHFRSRERTESGLNFFNSHVFTHFKVNQKSQLYGPSFFITKTSSRSVIDLAAELEGFSTAFNRVEKTW